MVGKGVLSNISVPAGLGLRSLTDRVNAQVSTEVLKSHCNPFRLKQGSFDNLFYIPRLEVAAMDNVASSTEVMRKLFSRDRSPRGSNKPDFSRRLRSLCTYDMPPPEANLN